MGIRDLLMLVPFLLSDGGMSPKGKAGWLIYFRNNDKNLVDYFVGFLEKVATNKIQIKKRADNSYMVRVNDKALGNELEKVCFSFRTRPCIEYPYCPGVRNGRTCNKAEENGYHKIIFPKEFYNDDILRKLFLKIYFSCDGGVSITSSKGKYPFLVRKVFVSVKNPSLVNNIRDLLVGAGFVPMAYQGQIRLTTKGDIERFNKEIGFVDGTLVGGNSIKFRGYEKNQLLRMLIESYQNPKGFVYDHFVKS